MKRRWKNCPQFLAVDAGVRFESGSDMTDQMEVSMKDKMKAMIEEQAQKQMDEAASKMTDEQKAAIAMNPELQEAAGRDAEAGKEQLTLS